MASRAIDVECQSCGESAALNEDGECTDCAKVASPVHRIPLMTLSEEKAQAAIAAHQGLVHQFARRLIPKAHVVHWLDYEYLLSCGNVAILEAVVSYDPARGARIGTWVANLIRQRMLEEVRRARAQKRTEQQTASRLHSLKHREEARKRAAAAGKPAPVYPRPDPPVPTPDEVAALKETLAVRAVSAYMPLRGEGETDESFTLFDILPADPEDSDPSVIAERKTKMRWLRQTMRRLLTAGERQAVLSALEGDEGVSLAQQLGLSRQRVAQLRDKGLKKLRWAAKEMGWIAPPVPAKNGEPVPEPPLRLRPRRCMPEPVPC